MKGTARTIRLVLALLVLGAPRADAVRVGKSVIMKAKGGTQYLTISANTQEYNVHTALGSPASAVAVELTVNAGIYVWSDNAANPALTTGNLPSGSTLKIINNGIIMGKGGGDGGGGGGGGGYGKSGGAAAICLSNSSSPGSGGNAVSTNTYSVTWLGGGPPSTRVKGAVQ